ncbi:ImmA/IrrE family metallo-endopeptidase [Paenibacillus sp. ACRRX]|uniref:ImmA/IrrE family metallo-endopeptidase n=1 Tax=Paenibacillus sp. ACRRX TaxID=2918206 RepID=UPI001EF6CC7C|nr:ImmA/IrrE family metallo-endopeptidase [Paenibacillus sp. ACRRX]
MRAQNDGIVVYEYPLKGNLKGLYKDGIICIDKRLDTSTKKACILSEEIGHHHTSCGNILDKRDLNSIKQEKLARVWAYKEVIPIESFINAHVRGIRNRYEFAEHLEVTEEFLEASINYYKEKYGLFIKMGAYTICLEPLGVLEFFE